jgi:hypothetical protein
MKETGVHIKALAALWLIQANLKPIPSNLIKAEFYEENPIFIRRNYILPYAPLPSNAKNTLETGQTLS